VLLSGNIADRVNEIRSKPGKDIWLYGGAELTTAFINGFLVGELWLAIHPMLLGAGRPLFQNILGRKDLKVLDHKVYDTGLVSVCYQPV
jgi:dihydrofolate reductase